MQIPSFSDPAAPETQLLHGNFVAMRADDLWLILPQDDVLAADRLDKQAEGFKPADRQGLFSTPSQSVAGQDHFYAALSNEMQLLSEFPTDRYLATTFVQQPIFWCWNEVDVLINVDVRLSRVPDVIKKPNSPIHAMAHWQHNEIYHGFLCLPEAIVSHALGNFALGDN